MAKLRELLVRSSSSPPHAMRHQGPDPVLVSTVSASSSPRIVAVAYKHTAAAPIAASPSRMLRQPHVYVVAPLQSHRLRPRQKIRDFGANSDCDCEDCCYSPDYQGYSDGD